MTPQHYEEINQRQKLEPVHVLSSPRSRRRWWLYQDRFYWEDDGLTVTEVKALLLQRMRKKEREIERAVAMMEKEETSSITREPIPDDVKIFVWNRDGGKCVKCGSQKSLEYDHIIPLSKGGSNTERNLQLLCETCNRTKGANLA